MGLFGGKTCAMCGQKAGLITRTKLADGYLCDACNDGLSGFSSGWKEHDLDGVRRHLEIRERCRAAQSQFVLSAEAGMDGLFQVDFQHGWFRFAFGRDWEERNPLIFPVQALRSIQIVPDYIVDESDKDGDGVADRFDFNPAQGGSFVTKRLGQAASMLGFNGGRVDARSVELLLGNVGGAGYLKPSAWAYHRGLPNPVKSLALRFEVVDEFVHKVEWHSRDWATSTSAHEILPTLDQLVLVIQLAEQLCGEQPGGLAPGQRR